MGLFLRHTRAVELTSAGSQLLPAVSQSLPRIDGAVRQIRQSAGRRTVARDHLRLVRLDVADPAAGAVPARPSRHRHPHRRHRRDARPRCRRRRPGAALRARRRTMPPDAIRLFGEQLTPVASPWLLKSGPPLKKPADLAQFALIEDATPDPPGMADVAALVRRAGPRQAATQALAVLQLQLPDGAGGAHRPGRGAGAAAAGGRKPGQRRPGGAAARLRHGFAQWPTGWCTVRAVQQRPQIKAFSRVADGPGPGHAPDHRRGSGPGRCGRSS